MTNAKSDMAGRRLSIGCVLLIGGVAVQCGNAVENEPPSSAGGASANGGSGNASGGHVIGNVASGGSTLVGLPARGGASNDDGCFGQPSLAAGSAGEVWCNPGVPPR